SDSGAAVSPVVFSTAVGYAAGHTPNPTYQEVCTGGTGHNEVVRVVFDPGEIDYAALLRIFWESHDPTQGYRQGNDTGTQYRSAVYYTTDAQREMVERTSAAYAGVIAERGYGDITTQVAPAADWPYYFAEAYHQQYLYKVPNGYRCHANTGLALPAV
ncbi:MAG: peptide-methionine (S)-S-oxide reductase MsrA, partial [Candidatus Nanopelagicales bacterium]